MHSWNTYFVLSSWVTRFHHLLMWLFSSFHSLAVGKWGTPVFPVGIHLLWYISFDTSVLWLHRMRLHFCLMSAKLRSLMPAIYLLRCPVLLMNVGFSQVMPVGLKLAWSPVADLYGEVFLDAHHRWMTAGGEGRSLKLDLAVGVLNKIISVHLGF